MAATVRNAETLLEEGYRLVPYEGRPLTYDVFKPGKESPSYQVTLRHDGDEGDALTRRAWRYRCLCPLFLEQEGLQERHALSTGYDGPVCKHGERALSEWLRHLTEVSAVLGYVPDIPRPMPIRNYFSTAPRAAAAASGGGGPRNQRNPSNPWPTRGAVPTPVNDGGGCGGGGEARP